ncbi:hypothetical protein PARPLA_02121 [Rhodobacteraceae bacterium THAF1]|uniref:M48 family metallopeptidase n=1 Tax=Palleronia sp. THAF1 TaxID=2587842 RepID=UPI000F3B7209|nr:SprT family zinc-dependent metalloprotease [Palleronia sp. THAF1]QFU07833.1 hypothetical protein FIU81_04010 [Palleronia sp. THAF1]VDC25656.1 hypothetical protein PARPLA_02121 [Rhodobacteraceae bacterium THAF1]
MKRLDGEPPLDILCRVSARARRISLRVSSLDGRVTLTRPRFVSEAEALRFAETKADWLRAQTGRVPEGQSAVLDGTVPVGGVSHGIIEGRPGLGDGVLRVRTGRAVGPQVAAILRETARARLAEAVARHATALGRVPGRLTLRDTRSRWGSCNHKGDLMFSWRLVMAPWEVLDYVAAHEVAHLEHMDHSAAFWEACARLRPDWRNQRDWLRAHGAALHAWRFDD